MRTELVFSGSPSADLDVDHGETASGDQFLSLTRSRQDSILSEQILIVFPTTDPRDSTDQRDKYRRRQVDAITQIMAALDRIRLELGTASMVVNAVRHSIDADAGNHFAGMPDDVVIPFLDRGRDVGAGE